MNARLSPVEAYLADLFDQLAGRGAAGRRVLVETEDHLRCVVAELEAAGRSRVEAEQLAVDRVGPADQIAGALRSVSVLPWPAALARVVGAAWLLAVVGLLSLGASLIPAFGAAALWGRSAIVSDPPTARYSATRCGYLLEYYPQPDGSCRAASVAHHYEEEMRNRFAAAVLGGGGLAAFVLARRRFPGFRRLRPLTLTPPMGVVAAVGATGFGLGALVGIGQGIDQFLIGRPWGAWSMIISGVALLPACAWFTYRILGEVRRSDSAGAGAGLPAVAAN